MTLACRRHDGVKRLGFDPGSIQRHSNGCNAFRIMSSSSARYYIDMAARCRRHKAPVTELVVLEARRVTQNEKRATMYAKTVCCNATKPAADNVLSTKRPHDMHYALAFYIKPRLTDSLLCLIIYAPVSLIVSLVSLQNIC